MAKGDAEVLEHVDEPPRERSMLAEAKVLLTIAEILEPFDDEQKCRIMASACTALGEYNYAEAFIRGAKAAGKRERAREASGADERPAWEDP